MSVTTTRFTNEKTPCGQIVDAERLRDRDEECLLSDEHFYDCGCRSIRHEYHDGNASLNVIHHDATVMVDELIAER